MARLLFCLFVAASAFWSPCAFADPSKPIRDAMNHPASAFDFYMQTLRSVWEREFDKEREEAQLGRFMAALIEKGKLIDKSAKEGEPFSEEFVAMLKSRPNYSFSSFTYDFQTNRFTLSLGISAPDTFPLLESDLSFEGEQKRKAFMEEVVDRAWQRVSYKFTTVTIQNGYTSKAWDEEGFKKEVAENTNLEVRWDIFTRASNERSELAKLLAAKGVTIRTYTATRSAGGRVSVDYDDFMPEEKNGRPK
jgi:hypothetical protein